MRDNKGESSDLIKRVIEGIRDSRNKRFSYPKQHSAKQASPEPTSPTQSCFDSFKMIVRKPLSFLSPSTDNTTKRRKFNPPAVQAKQTSTLRSFQLLISFDDDEVKLELNDEPIDYEFLDAKKKHREAEDIESQLTSEKEEESESSFEVFIHKTVLTFIQYFSSDSEDLFLPDDSQSVVFFCDGRFEEYPLFLDEERVSATDPFLFDSLSIPVDEDLVDNDCRTTQYQITYAKTAAENSLAEAISRINEIVVHHFSLLCSHS